MIAWTQDGPLSIGNESKNAIEEICTKANSVIASGGKITVRDFYQNYLGLKLPSCELLISTFDGEFFIDPDDWGWDKKGFRQLYRTKTIREEL
jgi:hypothetical protein